jgi:hypothetical protein
MSCATEGFSAMISDLLIRLVVVLGERSASLQSGLLARTCTRAHP